VQRKKTKVAVSPDLVEAVDKLMRADPARVVALASSLRAPDRALESTVEGTSMGRGLPPRSRIRIALIRRERYETGEVVAFLDANSTVVHRVVHRGRLGAAAGYLLTRGDATLIPDPPVNHDQILGPVTGVWVEGRWVPPCAAPCRSLRARAVSSIVTHAAAWMMVASPRATRALLMFLARAARDIRRARNRQIQRQSPVPTKFP
jgi:hypothetical protein